MPEELTIVVEDETAPTGAPAGGGDGTGGLDAGDAAEVGIATAAVRTLGVAVGAAALGVTALAAGFAGALIALNSFTNTIEEQVDQLAGLSGQVAAAQARSQVSTELLQIRRAIELGPELARAEDTRSRLEDARFQLETELLEIQLRLFNRLEPLVDLLSKLLELTAQFLDEREDLVIGGLTGMIKQIPVLGQIVAVLEIILERIEELVENNEPPAEDPFTQEFLNLLPRNEEGEPLFWPEGLAEPGV